MPVLVALRINRGLISARIESQNAGILIGNYNVRLRKFAYTFCVKNQWVGLVFFGLLWSAFVLSFDSFVGHGVVKQFCTKSFPSVTGYVTRSEMTVHHGKGTSYGVNIQYHYEVNGQSFEGNRFRYGPEAADFDWASRTVNLYHTGAEVPIYYNSSNPSESVLSPGIRGSDLEFILFLTPFNAIMVGFWVAGVASLRVRFFGSTNGGIKFYQDGELTRIRLPRYSAFSIALAVTGGVAFIEVFLVAIFHRFLQSGLGIASAPIILAYGSGVIAFLWQMQVDRSGKSDLVIDRIRQSVELPRTFGRKMKIQIPISDIKNIFIETVVTKSRKGGTTYTYVPTISWRGAESGKGKLSEFYTKPRAEKFVAWLRSQFKLSDSNPENRAAWKSSMPAHKDDSDRPRKTDGSPI